MQNRPSSITAIAWIIIAFGILGLLSGVFGVILLQAAETNDTLRSFIPESSHQNLLITLVGALVYLVCGQKMLKGENWARYAWIGWAIIGLVYGLISTMLSESSLVRTTAPTSLFFSVAVYGVAAYFLFRSEANNFFTGTGGEPTVPGDSPSAPGPPPLP